MLALFDYSGRFTVPNIDKIIFYTNAFEKFVGCESLSIPLVIIQQYPPGTQNNYVGFLNLFVITETGKELNSLNVGRGL